MLLAVLGIFLQQQPTKPNQEIVLQFSDARVNSFESKQALTSITEQLQAIGIQDIHVYQKSQDVLVISYFSEKDALEIEALLSEDSALEIGYTSHEDDQQLPRSSEQEVVSYNLDVYEIQNQHDQENSLNGTVVELNLFADRFVHTNVFVVSNTVSLKLAEHQFKTQLKVLNNVEHTLSQNIREIPEVRAGPTC